MLNEEVSKASCQHGVCPKAISLNVGLDANPINQMSRMNVVGTVMRHPRLLRTFSCGYRSHGSLNAKGDQLDRSLCFLGHQD
jgi:hypothetical protein